MRDWADNPIAMFLVLRTCLRVAPVVARSTGIFCAADAAKNRSRWALGWRRVGNAMRRRVSGGRAADSSGAAGVMQLGRVETRFGNERLFVMQHPRPTS